jgi:ketosteroid isomerase-like protein
MPAPAQDCEDIRQLIARYCHHVDSVQAKEVVGLFSSDAVLDMAGTKTQGAEAIEAFFEGLRGVYEVRPMLHHVTNVVIDVDGDDATSQSYIVVMVPGDPIEIAMTGRYDDRFRRIDGQWRFVERRMTPDARPS